MTLGIPLVYVGDAVGIAAHIKTDIETGWYESQSLLGAPHGQVYHDWKTADNLHHVIAAFAGLFINNFGVVMNLYYLAGYVLAALAAAWFLRLVGVSRVLSAILAVLYAIAPYHLFRSEHHLWLTSYYPIPLALGIVYFIARGQSVWTKNERFDNRFLAWVTGRGAFAVIALALVASANSYYALWTVLFIAFVGLARFIRDRNWRRFIGAVVAGGWTVVVIVVNMAPDLIYSAIHGANPAAVARYPIETEANSLKLIQLILPQWGHRSAPLAELRAFYDSVYPYSTESPALGLVAAVGFVAALAIALYAVFVFGVRRNVVSLLMRNLGVLSALTLAAFLLSTFGGLSSIISLFTSDLRGWNRMVIAIAMFALALTGLLIDATVRRLTRRITRRRFLQLTSIAVASLVLLVGYWDQTTPVRVPDYVGVRATFEQDANMVAAIEQAVAPDSMILQLPFREYPESGSDKGVSDTDQLRPYLHSDTLRWSGGGIKGRPASMWVGIAEKDLTTPALMYAAAAAGFGGVLFDRMSYELGEVDQIETDIVGILGEPVYRSADGRYAFFTTNAAKSVLDAQVPANVTARIGEALVNPVLATFSPDNQNGYSVLEGLSGYAPKFTLENPRESAVDVEMSFTGAYRQGDAEVTIEIPDGSKRTFPISAEGESVAFSITVPAGTSEIDFSISAGSAPERGVFGDAGPNTVRNLSVIDPDLLRSLAAIPGLTVSRAGVE